MKCASAPCYEQHLHGDLSHYMFVGSHPGQSPSVPGNEYGDDVVHKNNLVVL